MLKKDAGFEVVAVNDIADAKTMAHLLQWDSTLGKLDHEVEAGDGVIKAAGQELKVLAVRDPKDLPWADLGVDVVLESTGLFTKREQAVLHLEAGAPDRKSTRLNSSHVKISYAVVCWKKRGKTNAVLHLITIESEDGVVLDINDLQAISDRVPLLPDLNPSGRYVI